MISLLLFSDRQWHNLCPGLCTHFLFFCPDWVLGLTQLARRVHSVLSGEKTWPWLDEDEDGEDGVSENLLFCGTIEGWNMGSVNPFSSDGSSIGFSDGSSIISGILKPMSMVVQKLAMFRIRF
jgi:hypothetical protein